MPTQPEPARGDLPRRPTQRRMVRRPEQPPAEVEAAGAEVGRPSRAMRELPVLIAVALGIALLIKTFLVQAFFIPSQSMENTLRIGDRVLVNKFAAHFGGDVSRGQVVVFKDPGGWLDPSGDSGGGNPVLGAVRGVFSFIGLLPSGGDEDLIKRVIGVAGDQVRCCTDGQITVNGEPLDEPYLFPGDVPSQRPFDVTVPPNRLWVMGDHRSASEDSRAHMDQPGDGTIPADSVVGRAFVLVWPLSRVTMLGVPETFERAELDEVAFGGAAAGLVVAAGIRRRRRAG